MKKYIIIMVMLFVSVVSSFATEYKTVNYLSVGNFQQGITVHFTDGTFMTSRPGTKNAHWASFIRTLRSGDCISFEYIEGYVVDLKKVGHESPTIIQNGGVLDSRCYGGYYGGSAHVGYTSRDGRTNVGVGRYSNGDGSSTVVVGGNVKGFHFNVPVTVKKKSTRRTATPTMTATTTTAHVKTVKTVSTTTTSTSTSAAVLYNASTLTEMF